MTDELDAKNVLPDRCQILRIMNKRPPQSTMHTKSEHFVGPSDAPIVTHQNCGLTTERSPRIPAS